MAITLLLQSSMVLHFKICFIKTEYHNELNNIKEPQDTYLKQDRTKAVLQISWTSVRSREAQRGVPMVSMTNLLQLGDIQIQVNISLWAIFYRGEPLRRHLLDRCPGVDPILLHQERRTHEVNRSLHFEAFILIAK